MFKKLFAWLGKKREISLKKTPSAVPESLVVKRPEEIHFHWHFNDLAQIPAQFTWNVSDQFVSKTVDTEGYGVRGNNEFDPGLLEQATNLWQKGDWEGLVDLNRDSIERHPERAKLALLGAAGSLQKNDIYMARELISLSKEWGVNRKLLARILISGVHNNLGRAATIISQDSQALKHFDASIALGTSAFHSKRLTKDRIDEQCNQLRLSNTILTTNKKIQSTINLGTGFLLINTVPKSGTYLMSSLLGELGVSDSCLHFRNKFYWDFKDKPIDDVISNPDQFKIMKPFNESVKLVESNQFCLAHLEYDQEVESILKSLDVRHIFMCRNLRDALVSSMRFMSDSRRHHVPSWANESDNKKKMIAYLQSFGNKYLLSFNRQANWIDKDSVVLIRFEDLMGDNGSSKQEDTLEKIIEISGVYYDQTDGFSALKSRVFGKKNRTYSGSRTDIVEYWSEEAEEIFLENIGVALNQRFGYE